MLKLEYKGPVRTDNRRLFYSNGRMVKDPKYRVFQDLMIQAFSLQSRGKSFDEPNVMIVLALRNRQIDKLNLLKAICDALQKARVVKNDNVLNAGWIVVPPVRYGEEDCITLYLEENK